MSNFFEQELRKLFGDGEIIHDPVFVGRACVGGLDAGRQVRAEFVTMGHADHYEALRLTLLDNDLGVVDKLTLRLKDVWGRKTIPNNPYLKNGVTPHIWVNDGKTDWYAYHPTPSDYQQLRHNREHVLKEQLVIAEDNIAFSIEMVIEGAFGYSAYAADLVDRGVVVAVLLEQLDGCFHDAFFNVVQKIILFRLYVIKILYRGIKI